MTSTETRTRDFSRRHRELDFTADGEKHICLPALPPESVQELLALVRDENIKTDLGVSMRIFDIVMIESEAVKLHARLTKASSNPLGLPQVLDIIEWLIEEYTSRPTAPSATSSTGSQPESTEVESGTSSTAGAQPAELIPSS